MANEDRNRTNAEKEPGRENTPAGRNGQPSTYPGGYGPAQGGNEPISDTNGSPKSPTPEPSREY